MALWWGSHLAPSRSASARALVPIAGHCWPVPPQETLETQKQVWISLLWDPWVHVLIKFCLSPLGVSTIWGLILNLISPFLPSSWGSSFALGCGFYFLCGIQHSPVDGCSAVGCNCGVLAECASFYSTIFSNKKSIVYTILLLFKHPVQQTEIFFLLALLSKVLK